MADQSMSAPLGRHLVKIAARVHKTRQRIGIHWEAQATQVEKDRDALLVELTRMDDEIARHIAAKERLTKTLKAVQDEADRWERSAMASASDYDKGAQAAARAINRIALDGRYAS